jgi:Tfp pilus assembly protein PilN
MMNPLVTMDPTLLDLTEKIDRLSTQITFLTEEAQRQKRRQQEWDELKEELQPIANEAYRLAVSHLQELDPEVQLEDLLRLLKRLLGNTRNFEQLLDQV